MGLNKLFKELESVAQQEDQILTEIHETRKRQRIECSCGKFHPIGKLTAIQTHWYTSPHGCTGGDYWSTGELQFICPTTEERNRLLFDNNNRSWKDRNKFEYDPEKQFSRYYKDCFANVVDEHGGKRQHRSVINRYVDQNRKRFRLVEKSDI